MRNRNSFPAALLLVMAMAACAPTAQDSGEVAGIAKIAVALTAADVDHVTLAITGGLVPFTVPMTKVDDTHYSAIVPLTPPGTYTFTANAYSATSVVIATGAATDVSIAPPGPVAVYIVMHEIPVPIGPTKKLPQVEFVVAAPATVPIGGTSTVTVAASSPEGHDLAYQWSDTCGGSFADATASSTTWTAPAVAGDCLLSMMVSDGTNATSVTVYITIKVIIIVEANVDAVLDTYPIVVLGTAKAYIVKPGAVPESPGPTVGITADLAATASDPDGSVVTFKWTSNPGCSGTFTPDDTTADVQFHADDPAANCTLTLTVSDTPPGAPYPTGTAQTVVATVVLTQP